jgi:hypothetical protein
MMVLGENVICLSVSSFINKYIIIFLFCLSRSCSFCVHITSAPTIDNASTIAQTIAPTFAPPALHVASMAGNLEGIALLLKFRCNTDVQNVQGDTALHLCGVGGHYDCAHALLAGGANKTLKNNAQETPYEQVQHTTSTMHAQHPNQETMKLLRLLQ